MKRAIFSCLTVVILIGLTGCIAKHGRRPWACMGGSCAQTPENSESSDGGAAFDGEQYVGDPGDPCQCRGQGCRLCGRLGHGGRGGTGDAGPTGQGMGTVAYPYYTTRGPRDFLVNNPPSIGP